VLKKSILVCSLLFAILPSVAQSFLLNSSSAPAAESGGKLCSDENGNVYLLGRFENTLTLGTHTINATGNKDIYLAKFDRYMQLQWLKGIGSTGNDVQGDLAYYDGRLYICGSYGAQFIIDDDTMSFSGFNNLSPGFISIVDTSGTFIDSKAFTTSNTISADFNGIAVNATGIAIAGAMKGQLNFGPGHVISSSGTANDLLVAKLDLNLNCLFAFETTSWYSSYYGEDAATDIEMDNAGNIYTAGYFGNIATNHSATLYWGSFTLATTGSNGFSDFFYAKLDGAGNCKWIGSGGGNLPDGISNICLLSDTALAIGGIYSDAATIGGLPLPPSMGARSRFIAVIDSAGAGTYGHRTGPEIYNFNALKKGSDHFIYAAAVATNSSDTYFSYYKVDPASGVQFKDSILVSSVGSYKSGDLLPPNGSCDQLIINSSFYRRAVHGTDTLLNHPAVNDIDVLFGKVYLQGGPVGTPSIDPVPLSHCSNSTGVALSVQPVANANTYHWSVVPAVAGAIAGSGTSVAYSPDPSYAGPVTIHCSASNACDISGEDSVVLTIHPAPEVMSVTASGSNTIETTVTGQTDFNWLFENSPLSFLNATSIPCQGSGTYMVVATNSNGCSDTLSNFISCSAIGLLEQNAALLKVYPNPAEDYITLQGEFSEGSFEICDVLGKSVIQTTGGTKINVAALAPGTYYLKFNGRNETRTIHFIKK
jgi:hypothetical protein